MLKRILIADDDHTICHSFRRLLEEAGYVVSAAEDGRQAEAKLAKEPVDLLILDLALLEREGWNVFGLANAWRPLLPIIILSESTDQTETAGLPGVAASLEKPVDSLVLLNVVSRLLAEPAQERLRRAAGGLARKLQRVGLVIAGISILCFTCSCLASPQPQNPYSLIAVRNVFGLRPPSAAASKPPAAPVAPSPTIMLTGITTILGGQRAFLEITAPAKPGQPAPKPQSCMLTVGQSEEGVEVVAIDPKLEHVTVSTGGKVVTLTFEQNGKKVKPSPPAPTVAQRSGPIIRNPNLRGMPFHR